MGAPTGPSAWHRAIASFLSFCFLEPPPAVLRGPSWWTWGPRSGTRARTRAGLMQDKPVPSCCAASRARIVAGSADSGPRATVVFFGRSPAEKCHAVTTDSGTCKGRWAESAWGGRQGNAAVWGVRREPSPVLCPWSPASPARSPATAARSKPHSPGETRANSTAKPVRSQVTATAAAAMEGEGAPRAAQGGAGCA